MKKLMLLFSVVFVLPMFAAPTVNSVKVSSIEPIGVAIDYIVSGATDADVELKSKVTLVVNGNTFVAKSLRGETNCKNGAHRVYWNMAEDGLDFESVNAILTVEYAYPLYCVIDLSAGSAADAYPIMYMFVSPNGGFNTTEYKTSKLVLKRVDAGTFTMGKLNYSENHSHYVTLTKPFYMGVYEVTQRQWELVMGSNPCSSTSYGKGNAYPVHYVSYDMIRGASDGAEWPATNTVDAISFLGKLRDRTKLDFDLPTEAQWEYTCRAGTKTEYSYGDSVDGAYMWYANNSEGSPHIVGTKLPNKWGFYDMHGNMWEWCLDGCYGGLTTDDVDPRGSSSGQTRIGRGGNWDGSATRCTSYYRGSNYPTVSGNYTGFRISKTFH